MREETVKVRRKLLPADAADKVMKAIPGATVKEMYDYSNEWYMVVATDQDDVDYNSPYYLVGKTNGRVCSFSPLLDFDKFDKALKNEIDFERR